MNLLVLVVAIGSYGVSLRLSPRLPTGRRVLPSGALVPALIALGPSGYAIAPLWLIAVGSCLMQVAATALMERGRVRVVGWFLHAALLGIAVKVFNLLAFYFGHPTLVKAGPGVLLAGVTLASLPFPFGDALSRGVARAWRQRLPLTPLIREEFRAGARLHLVFLSTAGLVTLSYAELGVTSFVILLVPLFAAHLGFSRFSEARQTYEQTVRALGKLAESAGYATEGHHERVAQLSVAMARELGIWGERVRKLELVALLHDVGAVSVPDPEDLVLVDPSITARAGRRVLEETGYLAPQAGLLTFLAASPHEAAPIDARILRVASRYDELATTTLDPMDHLSDEIALEDQRVLSALGRALSRLREPTLAQ